MGSEPFELSLLGYYPETLRVLSFRGREAVNALYQVEIHVVCREGPEQPLARAVLDRPASLLIHTGAPRAIHGIVAAASLDGTAAQGEHLYTLRLVPRLWLGKRRRACRVFQDLSAVEIVEGLLAERGVPFRRRLQATYPKRPYCVQYQESDYGFMRRLLGEEGIFFSFDHPASLGGDTNLTGHGVTETVVLCDAPEWCAPVDGGEELTHRPAQASGGLVADESSVERFGVRRKLGSRAVYVRRYDFRRPGTAVSGAAIAAARGDLAGAPSGSPSIQASTGELALRTQAVFDEGQDLEEARRESVPARVMLDQLRARLALGVGGSSCPRLMPARRFVLRDADPAELGGAYLCVSVDHDGVAAEAQAAPRPVYHNTFACVPAEVPLRPPRPKRRLRQVTETATVVGPPGEEIYTDPLGRVKVQFHWDIVGKMNERSSCWLRVAQAWAGAGWGAQIIPRIGMEVLVTFLGGDADRPLVTGAVYNATHPPPYPLPEHKTRTGLRSQTTPGGGGSNEIAFDDKAGGEQLYIHAERNLDEEVGNDRRATIRGNRVETVGRDAHSVVTGARADETLGDAAIDIRGSRSAQVGGFEALHVAADRIADIGGSERAKIAKDVDVTIAGHRRERIGQSDDLVVAGDRSVVVRGEDARVVWSHARTLLNGDAVVNVAGALSLSVGSKAKPKHVEGLLSGDLSLKGDGAVELSANKGFRLRVGKTLVVIGPDEVSIEADTIKLKAKSIEGRSEKSVLSLGESVELSGKTVKIVSEDKAILELDKEAKLDGPAVKIKPGLAAEAKKAEEREEQAKDLEKQKVHLFDRTGRPIPNAPYEVSFFGYLDEGTAADGTVEIPRFPDVEKAHLRWGRPTDQRPDPNNPDPYEFEMDVFLVVDHDDADEALRRKLHNLGHQGRQLHEAVHKMQAAMGGDRTGSARDVASEVASRHEGVQPVERGAKGA